MTGGPSVRRCDIANRDVDALDLGVVFDRGAAVLTTETRKLDATERQLDRGDVVLVDPTGAGLEAGDDAVRARELTREYARGKTERRRIGAFDDLLLIVEHPHRHDRSEDLFAHDCHVVVALGGHGWRDEIAVG